MYDIPFMWNLKRNNTNELTYKTARETHRFIKTTLWLPGVVGKGQLGSLGRSPIDGSPPGSPVSGILQARTLECVAVSFSNA